MSTFVLSDSSPKCTVSLPDGLTEAQLLSFPAFSNWVSTLQRSLSLQATKGHPFRDAPYKLRKIEVQAVDYFGKGRLGFVKLKSELVNDKGEKLPGSVFLRGGSVAMMVDTRNDHDYENLCSL